MAKKVLLFTAANYMPYVIAGILPAQSTPQRYLIF